MGGGAMRTLGVQCGDWGDPEPACAARTPGGPRTRGPGAAGRRRRAQGAGSAAAQGRPEGAGRPVVAPAVLLLPRTRKGEGGMHSGWLPVSGPLLAAAVQSPRR